MTKKLRDITDVKEVDKLCKQPNNNPKDKNICFDCPLFLGFCCYANIIYLLDQEIEVKENV